MALDKKTEERIEQPVSEQAQRETRLAPAEAVDQMRIRVPERGEQEAPHAARARQRRTSG